MIHPNGNLPVPGHPGYPGRPGSPGPTGAPGRPGGAARGFGLAALIVGLVALLLCWVPLVNLLLIPVGAAGIGLAVTALVLGRRSRSGRGLAVAGLVLSVAGTVGAGLAHAFYSSLLENAAQSVEQAHEEFVEEYNELRDGSTDKVFDLGDALRVGGYRAVVTAADAGAAELQASEAGAERSVSVLLTVQNVGDADAEPGQDLVLGLRGADGARYPAVPCPDDGGHSLEGAGRLAPEQSADVRMCVQAPADAFNLGRLGADEIAVYLAPAGSEEERAVYWALEERPPRPAS